MTKRGGVCGGLVAMVLAAPLAAQSLSDSLSLGAPVNAASPVVTLNQDRLFAESLYGKRVARGIDADFEALAVENERLKEDLEAEERRLTEARPTLAADEFRRQADAFDQRVIRTRSEQDTKERSLQRRAEREQQVFFNQILPILAEVVSARGAVAILDERAVFLALGTIDITDEALRRVDAAVGEGVPTPETDPEATQMPELGAEPDEGMGLPETTGSDP